MKAATKATKATKAIQDTQVIRRGDAKSLEMIFKESNSELLSNLMKGIHLDGGGKLSHYKDLASTLHSLSVSDKAEMLYNNENKRFQNLRVSILKRSVLLKMRFESNGCNVSFENYKNQYERAIADTKNHSTKLKPSIYCPYYSE